VPPRDAVVVGRPGRRSIASHDELTYYFSPPSMSDSEKPKHWSELAQALGAEINPDQAKPKKPTAPPPQPPVARQPAGSYKPAPRPAADWGQLASVFGIEYAKAAVLSSPQPSPPLPYPPIAQPPIPFTDWAAHASSIDGRAAAIKLSMIGPGRRSAARVTNIVAIDRSRSTVFGQCSGREAVGNNAGRDARPQLAANSTASASI
jgi:hypothetical protein